MKFKKRTYLFDEKILNAFNDEEKEEKEEKEIVDDMPTNSIIFSLEKGSGKYEVPEKFKDVDVDKITKQIKITKKIIGKFNGVKETSYAISGNTIPEELWSALMKTKQESVMYVNNNLKAEFWELIAADKPKYKKVGGGTLKELTEEPNRDYSKVDGKFYVIDEKLFELVDVFYDEEEENMELTGEELKVLKGLVAFIKNFKLEDEEEKEDKEIVDDEDEEEKEVKDEDEEKEEETEADTEEVEDEDEEEKEELEDDEEDQEDEEEEEEKILDTKKRTKDSFSAFNSIYNKKINDDSWEDDRQIEVASAWARRK